MIAITPWLQVQVEYGGIHGMPDYSFVTVRITEPQLIVKEDLIR